MSINFDEFALEQGLVIYISHPACVGIMLCVSGLCQGDCGPLELEFQSAPGFVPANSSRALTC